MSEYREYEPRRHEGSFRVGTLAKLHRRSIKAPQIWLGAFFVLAACTSPKVTQHLPSTLQEAASIHVAVLSIAQWSEYESILQPEMSVTIADAENMALPMTSEYMRNVYDTLNGKVSLGWGKANTAGAADQASTTAASPGSGTTQGNGGGSGSGSGGKTTKKDATGGASRTTAASEASAASAADIASAPGSASDTNVGQARLAPLQSNPLLQHQLALSIYQEMQILSHYLKDAAFKNDWTPYIVRAQISVSPYAHNQPFDVYVDLGLFSKCLDHNNNEFPDTQQGTKPALAIPLLVTDTVEAQQASNTVQLARDLALGLGGNIGNVALQGDLEKVSKNLQSILGTDYNSLYTVSRSTDSVIQVRFGAPVNAMSQYSMSTVTHNITLVVLMPACAPKTDHQQLDMATLSHLRNAISGKILDVDQSYGVNQAQQAIARVHYQFLNSTANNPTYIRDLIGYVRAGKYSEFLASLHQGSIPLNNAEYLWAALGDVGGTTEFTVASADLPTSDKGHLADTKQIVYLQDSASGSIANLVINPEMVPATQSAELLLGSGNLVLVANSITTTNDGRTLQIQFPPLAPLKSMPGNIVPARTGRLNGALVLQPEVERWTNGSAAAPIDSAQSTAKVDGRYEFFSLLYVPTAAPSTSTSSPSDTKPKHKPAKKVPPVVGAHAPAASESPAAAPLPAAPSSAIPQKAPTAGHGTGHKKPDQPVAPPNMAPAG